MDSARYQDLQLGGTTASQGTTLQDRQDRQRRLNKQKDYFSLYFFCLLSLLCLSISLSFERGRRSRRAASESQKQGVNKYDVC